jgi:peptidoglycan/LPS O-acetylase OafA/YrhL
MSLSNSTLHINLWLLLGIVLLVGGSWLLIRTVKQIRRRRLAMRPLLGVLQPMEKSKRRRG